MFYAGMDIGTSGCKMLVYDLDGNVVYSAARPYRETGKGGHRELDPSLVEKNVKDMLREAGDKCPHKISAMAIASLGESIVCLDAQDKPLMNAMLTGDNRGIPETQRIIEKFGADKIFEITGLPPNELYSLPKWLWMREQTDVLERTDKMLFFEDYIGYLLTGQRKVSYFSAARSMAFDVTKKEWSDELLAVAGLDHTYFSEPAAPFEIVGTILPEMAEELHLPKDMKIVSGGHDQTCAAFGSGLSGMSTGEVGMGTCEFLFTMLPGPKTTEHMRENDFTCIPYVLENTFLSSIEITTCGILKNWARDTIFDGIRQECERTGKNFFAEMDRRAKDIKTDVMVLPQFGSAGNPNLSMDARGTITGLTIHTTPEEIYRGILEGMALQSCLAYELLMTEGTQMHCIIATGGGAASSLANQIRADVFDMTVRTLQSDESGTLGCMMMAAIGDGAYASVEEAFAHAVKIREEFLPSSEEHRYYMQKYMKFKRFYELMNDFK